MIRARHTTNSNPHYKHSGRLMNSGQVCKVTHYKKGELMTITEQRDRAMKSAMAILAELLLADRITLGQRNEVREAHAKLYNSLNGIPEPEHKPL